MLRTALLIAKKDLKLILKKGAGISQALLLGLLLIFLFSLSMQSGEKLSPNGASTMFWLSSVFCQVLVFQLLYQIEDENKTYIGLNLLPCPLQAIWLGKFVAGFIILLFAQLIFIPAMFVFLNQNLGNHIFHAFFGIISADFGICACGSLLGALCLGQGAKDSIISIILFPLLIPLLLAAISLTSLGLADTSGIQFIDSAKIYNWHGLVLAFNALFCALAIILFPFLYGGDI